MDDQFVSRMQFCGELAGSVAALARLAGVSQSGIRKYYQGAEPTRPVLMALSQVTGVSLIWLASGHGLVCDLKSPLLVTAKQELSKNFEVSRHSGEMQNLALTEGATTYCEAYNEGSYAHGLPDWVPIIIPKLHPVELVDWFQGKLPTPPKALLPAGSDGSVKVAEGWLQAPADLVVAVVRELPYAFGEAYLTLDRQKEAHVLRSVVDFVKAQTDKDQGVFLKPELLRPQIQFAAHLYDQDEKSKAAGERSSSLPSGDY